MQIECSICCNSATEDICATNCGHVFHYTCLIDWLSRSGTCPQCRTEVHKEDCIRLFVNDHQSPEKIISAKAKMSLEDKEVLKRFDEISQSAKAAYEYLLELPSAEMIKQLGKNNFVRLILEAKIVFADWLKMCQIVSNKCYQRQCANGGPDVANTSSRVDNNRSDNHTLKTFLNLEERIVGWNKDLTDLLCSLDETSG